MGNRYKFSVDISVKNREVTGSCIHITVHRSEGDIKFMVDCGLHQGEDDYDEKNYAKFDFKPENLEFLLCTHVHCDHSGRIPLLYKRGFGKKTYCTEDTSKLLNYALYDDAKIIGINSKRHEKKPLYDESDVERTLSHVEAVAYGEKFTPYDGVDVTFFNNAHLVGSAMILVQIHSYEQEDINLLFMGDYKKENMFFTVPDLPEWVKALPLHVVCESTYGHVDSSVTKVPVFCDNIEKWVNEGKKTIVILTLSLGRHQEIAYVLRKMQEEGRLSKSIPIWFDGNLAIKYTCLYKTLNISPEKKDFMPFNSNYITDREAVFSDNSQQIIVTTSGGGNFGPAPEYISNYIEEPSSAFHFTSYLWEDSLGRQMLNSEKGSYVQVGSIIRKRVADVATTSEYSGHAKRDELSAFLNSLDNIRSLLITHGEPDVKEAFGEYCKENVNARNVAIAGMGYTLRLNTYGITKAIHEKPIII